MINDLRHAIRMFRKRPGFALLIVLTVGLGIGATAAIFTLFNAFLIKPLPFRDAGQLVVISDLQPPDTPTPASYPEFEDWRNNAAIFEAITAWFPQSMNLTAPGDPLRVRVMRVARGYFPALGVDAVAGRTFRAEEHNPGAAAAAVISSGLWQARFGGAPGALGKAIVIDSKEYVVVGVVPDEPFSVGTRVRPDVWVPLERDAPWTNRGTHYLQVVGKLKPGVTLEKARAGLAVLARQLEARSKTGHLISIEPLRERMFGNVRPTLLVLLAAAGVLLLMAAVNAANLLLARATSRAKEFAVRVAIGASRWRLLRQTVTESLVLAAAGGALGFAMAVGASRATEALWPQGVPRPQTYDLDWRVLVFVAGVALLSTLLFGLAPALQVSLTALNETLKDGWGHLASGRGRARSALVVSEIALACVLLIGAGLLLKSVWRLLQVDPGFHAENVLTMTVSLPDAKYQKASQREAFFDQVLARFRQLPGTSGAGAIVNLPLAGGGINGDISIVGRSFAKGQGPISEKIAVTPDYFRAMGMRLLRGRWFTEQDGTNGRYTVIINEAMARRFWPHEDPIGKRMDVQIGDVKDAQEIVGIVADVKLESLAEKVGYQTYIPYRQLPAGAMALVIRTTSDPAGIIPDVRKQILAVDPEQPVSNVKTMRQLVADSTAGSRMPAGIVGSFALFALILASIGIYGVVSYWVSQRTREIGIRSALGAQRRDILGLVIGRGMTLVAGGVLAGLAASLVVTRYAASLLYGVSTHDWAIMAAVSVLLAVVAFTACLAPAKRAVRVDPVVALRFE